MIFTLTLRTLRPLRLCGRHSEFRLRLCRARSFVVNIFFLTWLRLRRSSPSWLKHLHRKPGRTYNLTAVARRTISLPRHKHNCDLAQPNDECPKIARALRTHYTYVSTCQIALRSEPEFAKSCWFLRRSSFSILDLRYLNDSRRARTFRVFNRARTLGSTRVPIGTPTKKDKRRVIGVAHEKTTFTFCALMADGVECFAWSFT